jgi:hypothetical protein
LKTKEKQDSFSGDSSHAISMSNVRIGAFVADHGVSLEIPKTYFPN